MILVAIVDDDNFILDHYKYIINASDGFKCAGTYSNTTSAVQGISSEEVDVVLMDIDLEEENKYAGIDCVRQVRDKAPDVDIIMLTNYETPEVIFESLSAGARGYMVKNKSHEKILSAIKEVYHGGSPMNTHIARMIVESLHKEKNPYSLTPKEREVLHMLCDGNTYKVISEKLFISVDAVKQRIRSIYEKLEVKSNIEAVSKAFKEKLIP